MDLVPELIDSVARRLTEYGFTVSPAERLNWRDAGAGGLAPRARGTAASSRGWGARPTGLRVLFTLLTQPEAIEATLTDVAERSRVSVATAHRVMTDLLRQGILDEDRAGRFWVERPSAVRSWVEGYVRHSTVRR